MSPACRDALINRFSLILFVWFVVLLYGERFAFTNRVSDCSWPETGAFEDTHVVLITDPQLTDSYSYDYMSSGGVFADLTSWYSDLFMRKAFRRVQSILRPDAVYFLGDLFDGGRVNNDREYANEIRRFNWIFSNPTDSLKVFNVSGNHDIGIEEWLTRQSWLRYLMHFGPLNYRVQVGSYELVTICAPCLVTSDANPFAARLRNETLEFVSSLAERRDGQLPRILFTHIPLYRDTDEYIRATHLQLRVVQEAEAVGGGATTTGADPLRDLNNQERLSPITSGATPVASVRHLSTRPRRGYTYASNPREHGSSMASATFTPVGPDVGTGNSDNRLASAECGPHRQRGVIRPGGGVSYPCYQNVLSREISHFLLETLLPDLIFSGDDHDHCTFRHPVREQWLVTEHTLGTFSWLQGNLFPSMVLLSVPGAPRPFAVTPADPSDSDSAAAAARAAGVLSPGTAYLRFSHSVRRHTQSLRGALDVDAATTTSSESSSATMAAAAAAAAATDEQSAPTETVAAVSATDIGGDTDSHADRSSLSSASLTGMDGEDDTQSSSVSSVDEASDAQSSVASLLSLPVANVTVRLANHSMGEFNMTVKLQRETVQPALQARATFAVCFLPAQMYLYFLYGAWGLPTFVVYLVLPFLRVLADLYSGIPFSRRRRLRLMQRGLPVSAPSEVPPSVLVVGGNGAYDSKSDGVSLRVPSRGRPEALLGYGNGLAPPSSASMVPPSLLADLGPMQCCLVVLGTLAMHYRVPMLCLAVGLSFYGWLIWLEM